MTKLFKDMKADNNIVTMNLDGECVKCNIITIEKLLNEQDQEIQQLRKKNDELEEMIKTIDKVEFTHELVHILEKVEEIKYR